MYITVPNLKFGIIHVHIFLPLKYYVLLTTQKYEASFQFRVRVEL
jgi:hypothetical protein